MHQNVVTLAERRDPGPDRLLAALAAGPDKNRLAWMQRGHLLLGGLEARRRTYDDDPVHLLQREEELQDSGQGGTTAEPHQCLAAAAQA